MLLGILTSIRYVKETVVTCSYINTMLFPYYVRMASETIRIHVRQYIHKRFVNETVGFEPDVEVYPELRGQHCVSCTSAIKRSRRFGILRKLGRCEMRSKGVARKPC